MLSPSRTKMDVQLNPFASCAIFPLSFFTPPFGFLTETLPVLSVSSGSSSQPSFSMTLPSPPSFSAFAMTSSRRLTAALKLASERRERIHDASNAAPRAKQPLVHQTAHGGPYDVHADAKTSRHLLERRQRRPDWIHAADDGAAQSVSNLAYEAGVGASIYFKRQMRFHRCRS